MPQPTPFVRSYSFTDFQASNPSTPLPAASLDAELDHAADTLQGVLGNLALIQRDDGKLADGVVTTDAVAADLLQSIADLAPAGPQGDSAYAVAVENGFAGTEAEWLASLKSTEPGDPGQDAQNPNFTFNGTTTLAPGAPATVTVTGAYPDLNIKFGLPVAEATGTAVLADADYGDVAVSAGGSVMSVQTVLGGSIPSVEGHTHAIADITGLQAALDGKATVTALSAKADSAALDNYLLLSNFTWANLAGIPASFPPSAHTHDDRYYTDAEVDTLLAGKQPSGSYATTADLAGKAPAFTTVKSFGANQIVSDADHNNCYCMMTGATSRTITFGADPSVGNANIWVNRGTVTMIVVCGAGYYKDGASGKATTNFNLSPGDKLTAFHEGAGVWAFEVV